jgi:hypothetical protein
MDAQTRFTTDNTQGYTPAQLAEANAAFDRAVLEAGLDPNTDDLGELSALDHLAERVLNEMDDRPRDR